MSSETVSDALRDEVLHYLVHDKLVHFPLPWMIEADWTTEVVTAALPRRIVVKFPNATIAQAFIALAEKIDEERKEFDKKFERMVQP